MDEWVSPNDPVRVVREIVSGQLDLSAFLRAYETERGRPPYHPQAMVGLLLYGCCRGIVSSRRLAQACHQDISFRYLMGGLEPDYHTIIAFRKRFEQELKGLFYQVLLLCAAAGLVRLGHVSLDGTKVRANASKHKAMSYGRLLSKEEALEREIQGWFERARQEDAEDDERYGGDDDGFSLPEAMERAQTRLETLRLARVRLEREAREKAVAVGKPPDEAQVPEKAQTNFTDPESRIMHTPDGFQQCYNAQIVVDAESQVIVACEVSQAPPDVQRLVPMLEQIIALHGRSPGEMTADAGYASESNFAALDEAGVHAVIALRRYHRDEPPDADPAALRSSNRWPHRNQMRERLATPEGKAIYRLRKQTVEPVFGQVKAARGFRQFLCRGLRMVGLEWSLQCTGHNILKLAKTRVRA